MSEVTFCGHGKDVGLLEESQIIGMDKANKTYKKITETAKIGLKIVQCINNWKHSGEPLSVVRKCMAKLNCRKTTGLRTHVCLSCDHECKSNSTQAI